MIARLIQKIAPNQAGGADGVKIAVLRKGRAGLLRIWAAAHAQSWAYHLIQQKL